MITIPKNTKINNIRVTLDSGAEINCITLETAIQLGLLITKSQSMALKIITKTKSCFISYANNIVIIIGNLIIHTQFYIINISNTKIILSFPFF